MSSWFWTLHLQNQTRHPVLEKRAEKLKINTTIVTNLRDSIEEVGLLHSIHVTAEIEYVEGAEGRGALSYSDQLLLLDETSAPSEEGMVYEDRANTCVHRQAYPSPFECITNVIRKQPIRKLSSGERDAVKDLVDKRWGEGRQATEEVT